MNNRVIAVVGFGRPEFSSRLFPGLYKYGVGQRDGVGMIRVWIDSVSLFNG